MTRHLTLITGASRGMGLAMARQRLAAGHTVLCVARHASDELAAHAERQGGELLQWTHDLADSAGLRARLEAWLATQAAVPWQSATLINNAGVITGIAPLGAVTADEVTRALRVGLEAPMQLTAGFLAATAGWICVRKVLNISSGLGRRAMASQAGYCAAKAGMDHFTRCVALEEAARPHGARLCSLAPGVIDTDMQRQLRNAEAEVFPDRDRFVGLHQGGQLTSPDEAARQVLAFLDRADFGAEPVADVRG